MTAGHDGYHDVPAALDALAEARLRAELTSQLVEVRTRLDVLLDAACDGGWRVVSHTTDELYDRLDELRCELEEGP